MLFVHQLRYLLSLSFIRQEDSQVQIKIDDGTTAYQFHHRLQSGSSYFQLIQANKVSNVCLESLRLELKITISSGNLCLKALFGRVMLTVLVKA